MPEGCPRALARGSCITYRAIGDLPVSELENKREKDFS